MTDMHLDQLLKYSWQIQPFKTDIDLIQTVMEGFAKLRREKKSKRLLWTIHKPGCKEADHGLIKKSGDGLTDNDNKWFFHLWPNLYQLLKQNGANIKTHQKFLDAAFALADAHHKNAKAILQALDELLPELQILKHYHAQDPDLANVLRLLCYKPKKRLKTKDKNFQARPHIDQCAITQHIWDNKPGLFIIDNNNKPIPFLTCPEKILVFFGAKFHLASQGKIPALGHFAETDDNSERETIVNFTHIAWDQQQVNELVKACTKHYTQLMQNS